MSTSKKQVLENIHEYRWLGSKSILQSGLDWPSQREEKQLTNRIIQAKCLGRYYDETIDHPWLGPILPQKDQLASGVPPIWPLPKTVIYIWQKNGLIWWLWDHFWMSVIACSQLNKGARWYALGHKLSGQWTVYCHPYGRKYNKVMKSVSVGSNSMYLNKCRIQCVTDCSMLVNAKVED